MYDRRYASLRHAQPLRSDEGVAFDDHVFACILAAALDESALKRSSISEALAFSSEEATQFFSYAFPLDAAPLCLKRAGPVELADEEVLLRELLERYCAPDDIAGRWLIVLIARRAMRDDHLWQDLGLTNRGELSRVLQRHFPALHAGNVNNMRWKKYFYRQICELEGFTLCSAPHCSVCFDFAACFGEEDGVSRLAALARASEAA